MLLAGFLGLLAAVVVMGVLMGYGFAIVHVFHDKPLERKMKEWETS